MNFNFKTFGNLKAKKATLFLHGFPGPGVVLPEGEKRIDDHILESFNHKKDEVAYYLYYRGIMDDFMSFSFKYTIDESLAFYKTLSEQYESVEIIGRSWGGAVATNILHQTDCQKALLLTPFCQIPPYEVVHPMLMSFSDLHPTVILRERVEFLAREVDEFRKDHNPMDLAPQIKGRNIKIIGALRDQTVPIEHVREFANRIPNSELVELDTDHQFEGVKSITDD